MTSTLIPHPPPTLENAEVLFWVWSGERPFGVLPDIDGSEDSEVFGFAICRYAKSGELYRFHLRRIVERRSGRAVRAAG